MTTQTHHKKGITGEQLSNLKTFFSSRTFDPAAELVYLFGSRALHGAGPISDFDIAVYFSDTPEQRIKYKLEHQLATVLDTSRLDIVVLNRAPVELRYSVILEGLIVHAVSASARVDFESLTLDLYGDFLPVLRAQRTDILKGSNDETRIRRYRKTLGKTRHLLEEVRTLPGYAKG
jgi:predicted nucleotidyltransferase